MIVIERTKPNIVTIPFKVKNSMSCETIFLFPGNNILTNEQYEKVENHPFFKQQLDQGHLKINKRKLTKAEESGKVSIKNDPIASANQIRNLTVKEAEEVIEKLFDIQVLKAIKDVDKRKGIQNAVAEQIDKLTDHRKSTDNDED